MREGEARLGLSQLVGVVELDNVGRLKVLLVVVRLHFIVELGRTERSQIGRVRARNTDATDFCARVSRDSTTQSPPRVSNPRVPSAAC